MITLTLNRHTAEDAKLVQDLRRQGVPEDVIQAAYNNTQTKREKEEEQSHEAELHRQH